MSLTAKQRRELLAASHALRPVATLSEEGVSEAAVGHVRTSFGGASLVKVRVATESRAACERIAAELAERVPCEVVKRLGRVVLLYRPERESDAGG